MITAENITALEIENWKVYESVRASGMYNMMSSQAREATGLSRSDYFFTLKNYSALKAAAEGTK
jgi:hypothetical protein